MTDILVGLPTVCLIALILGAGWAAVFHRVAPYGTLAFIFLAWTCAIVSTSVVWAWVYPLGQGVGVGVGTLVLLALTGYGIALWRGSFQKIDLRTDFRPLAGIGVAVAVTVLALLPAVANSHNLSVGQRIGPDEIGYAVSAQAFGNGLTRTTIEHRLATQLVGGTVETALTPRTEQVDKIPSLTIQVQNEFLTGADRWGLAGAVGSVVYLFGSSHLWSALSLLAAFAFFTTCIGLWIIVRAKSRSAWAATSAVIVLGLSPSVLNAWHEGGLAQIWVMPAVLLLALSALRLREHDRMATAAAAALGVAGMLPAYNSELPALAAMLVAAMMLSIPLLRRSWWSSWWPIACGAICGGALVSPSTAALATTFARSLHENGSAGWPQPRWSSLAEAFGLSSTYNTLSTVVGRRSSVELVRSGIENALIDGLLVGLIFRVRLRASVVLLSSVALLVLAVYVQSRYLQPSSDYQYFKAIVALAPAGALGFGVLLGESLIPHAITPDVPMRRARHRPPVGIWVASVAVAVAVAISGLTYVVAFRQQGSVVPASNTELTNSVKAQSAFEHYNVVAPRTLAAFAIGAEVNLNWIGRYTGHPSTRLSSRLNHPVALMIIEKTCPLYACLSRLRPGTVVLREGGVALVRLSPTTVPLTRIPEETWPDWVAARYAEIGGGQLVAMTPY
jgi:hypothetical protein